VLDEIVQEFTANLGAGQHLLGFNCDSLILASGGIGSGRAELFTRDSSPRW